jgi:hypothetical protein
MGVGWVKTTALSPGIVPSGSHDLYLGYFRLNNPEKSVPSGRILPLNNTSTGSAVDKGLDNQADAPNCRKFPVSSKTEHFAHGWIKTMNRGRLITINTA